MLSRSGAKPGLGAQHFSLAGRKIFVAGHRGMVGSALVRRLAVEDCEIVTVSRSEVDLTRQGEVEAWFKRAKPDAVFMAAAKVGGILANSQFPAEFLYDNLLIEANVIHAAFQAGAAKLLFLGSSCIYPSMRRSRSRKTPCSPALEPTNEWYALAKIAGLKLCQAYRRQYGVCFVSAGPTSLYGPNDSFDLASSHVLPALMAKIHAAKAEGGREVVIWGSGTPRREFLHVDDLADALVYLMKLHDTDVPINIGTGEDLSILELATLMGRIIGYEGSFVLDRSKPDGMPRKLLDISRIAALGWHHRISLEDGIRSTFEWYLANGTPGYPVR